jgi:rubrerythrin
MESDVTALEALGIAIRAEADASEIYREVAGRIGNPFLQQRLLVLGKEEQQHRRILEEAYKKQFPDVPLVLPDSQLPREICTRELRQKLSVREVLSCAIEQERRSRDFYLQAAESTTDLTGKAMFRYLADWEFSHQMALSAEHEMLVRYPRYFQQATEPWKPEFRGR